MSMLKEVRPGTARVQVTELCGPDSINPKPVTKPCEDQAASKEVYLTPEKLKCLCDTQDLSSMTSLEICVDTQENTLGNFGVYLPNLVQLKVNNSVIMSVRDLGTSLPHLQVLWMFRCSLQDLDGISTFSSLKELYAAYNNVSDLSPVGMLENLQVLDLEGNNVDDLVQVQYLGLCGKLERLTLEGNPLCVCPNPTAIQREGYSYRAAVRELIPQLRYLDNIRVEEDGHSCSSTVGEEWAVLRDSIRDFESLQAASDSDSAGAQSRPRSAGHPASSLSCARPLSSPGPRPLSEPRPMSANKLGAFSSPGSGLGIAGADPATVEAETSTLTHGAGKILFCGNPVQAIRARREKLRTRTAPTESTFTPRNLPIHVPEHTYDPEEPDGGGRADVFAMLRAWRTEHSRRLQSIKTERQPQVLSIQYSDEEEREDDDDEEDFGSKGNVSSDEGLDTVSLNSSFRSLSPDQQLRETSSPEVIRPSLSPDPVLSPCPPLCATAASSNSKQPGIRARRLRLSHTSSEHLPHCISGSSSIQATMGDPDLTLKGPTKLAADEPRIPPLRHKPRPPPTTSQSEEATSLSAGMDRSSAPTSSEHLQTPQRSKHQSRPVITRPHTARAALQKHQLHHTAQACRGGSHKD